MAKERGRIKEQREKKLQWEKRNKLNKERNKLNEGKTTMKTKRQTFKDTPSGEAMTFRAETRLDKEMIFFIYIRKKTSKNK